VLDPQTQRGQAAGERGNDADRQRALADVAAGGAASALSVLFVPQAASAKAPAMTTTAAFTVRLSHVTFPSPSCAAV